MMFGWLLSVDCLGNALRLFWYLFANTWTLVYIENWSANALAVAGNSRLPHKKAKAFLLQNSLKPYWVDDIF